MFRVTDESSPNLKVLVLDPNRFVQEAISGLRNIHVLNSDSVDYFSWTFDNYIITRPENFWSIPLNRYMEIETEIRSWTPIFVRHYDDMPQFELQLRNIAMCVTNLAHTFMEKNIAWCIFPTASSHHVNMMICELACRISGVGQIFNHETIFSNRVLPLVQMKNVSDRKPLGFEISQVKIDLEIKNYFTGELKWRRFDPSGRPISIYGFAIASVLYTRLRNYMRGAHSRLFKAVISIFNFGEEKASIKLFCKHTVLSEIRLIRNHRLANLRLKMLEANDEQKLRTFLGVATEKIPIIMASYQPEANSFPDGMHLNNAVNVVIELRNRGVTGPIIYREHPDSQTLVRYGRSCKVGSFRSVEYYETLSALGCIFASEELSVSSSPDLLPITITGTIGLERAMSGLNTVIAGYPWYRSIPGVIHLLEGENTTLRSNLDMEEIKEGARIFLQETLNNKTFVNLIMSHNPKNFKASDLDKFIEEFQVLLNQLMRTHPNQMF